MFVTPIAQYLTHTRLTSNFAILPNEM